MPPVMLLNWFEMMNASIRKWFRFSVRKLLAVIAASAVILASYLQLTSEYRQSRMSANLISAAGGTVSWSGDPSFRIWNFQSIAIVDLQNCKLTDEVYAALAKIPDYFVLMIDSDTFGAQATRKLAEIEYLSGLIFESGSVAHSVVEDLQEQRPDIMVTVLNGESGFREYPRLND